MLKTLFSNWTFMRLLRLTLSIIIIVQAVSTHDTVMSFAGILLLGMTIANIGCCGAGGCATASYKKSDATKKEQEPTYEEVV
jgi:hypothetical protein